MYNNIMQKAKNAFTLLELVIVIVVIGILTVIAMPVLNSDETALYNAANQVVSDIRYTQHLALIDAKTDLSSDWFKARWQIYFAKDNSGNSHQVYTIYSDLDKDDEAHADMNEIAISPVSQKKMTGDSLYGNSNISQMDLTGTYGVSKVEFTHGCGNSKRLFFDHIGRPLLNNNSLYNDILSSECRIKLTHLNGNTHITIKVEPETGYTCILNEKTNSCLQ